MLKAMIVDDEPRIRRGLKALIPQLDGDWTVCGEAKNGREALEMVKRELPDLVITDIRMPHMNGLDLLSALREYPVQVVILSGYGYFEYARTAIKFGAYDFLLKPVKPHDIKELLQRFKRERQSQQYEVRSSTDRLHYDKLWKEWLGSGEDSHSYEQRLRDLLPADVTSYYVMVIEIDHFDELIAENEWGDRQLVYFAVRNITYEILAKKVGWQSLYLFTAMNQIYCLLIDAEPERELLQQLKDEVRKWVRISISIAVSSRTTQFEALPELYEQARETMLNKWIYGDGTISLYTESQRLLEDEQGQYPNHLDRAMIQSMIGSQRQRASELLEEFVATIRGLKVPFATFRAYGLQLLSSVLSVVYERKLTTAVLKQISRPHELFNRDFTVHEYTDYMQQLLSACISALEEQKQHKRNKTLDRALTYIHNHYNQDISLDDVASYIQMGSSYFSYYFKQETGTTFVEYVTAQRLEKAKQLMMDGNLKIYEIAEMVGYQDVKYFSRVFKKAIGVTPAEYRQFFYREEDGDE